MSGLLQTAKITQQRLPKKMQTTHYNAFYEKNNENDGYIDLVVLNTPSCDTQIFQSLFYRANRVICADGGANRIFQHSQRYALQSTFTQV
jgi:hypothetical protein